MLFLLLVVAVIVAVVAVVAVVAAAAVREGATECPPEPSLAISGVAEILATAQQNAAATNEGLAALEARLTILETFLKDNTVTIDNTTYHELIIDTKDAGTFNSALPESSPLVNLVGSNPQKIKFQLPRGTDGPPGSAGLKGSDFTGPPLVGLRGPPGETSRLSALPEQWSI